MWNKVVHLNWYLSCQVICTEILPSLFNLWQTHIYSPLFDYCCSWFFDLSLFRSCLDFLCHFFCRQCMQSDLCTMQIVWNLSALVKSFSVQFNFHRWPCVNFLQWNIMTNIVSTSYLHQYWGEIVWWSCCCILRFYLEFYINSSLFTCDLIWSYEIDGDEPFHCTNTEAHTHTYKTGGVQCENIVKVRCNVKCHQAIC